MPKRRAWVLFALGLALTGCQEAGAGDAGPHGDGPHVSDGLRAGDGLSLDAAAAAELDLTVAITLTENDCRLSCDHIYYQLFLLEERREGDAAQASYCYWLKEEPVEEPDQATIADFDLQGLTWLHVGVKVYCALPPEESCPTCSGAVALDPTTSGHHELPLVWTQVSVMSEQCHFDHPVMSRVRGPCEE
jgi:hypothetical protein